MNTLKTGQYILVAKPSIFNIGYDKLNKTIFNAFKRLNTIKQ